MTTADRFLFITTLIALPFIYFYFWQPAQEAMYADIHVNGHYLQRVSLSNNQVLHVHGDHGDSVIEVQNGRVRFKNSPCTSKRCVLSGWLQHNGEFAACLPNRVSIALLNNDTIASRYDSINF